MTATYKQHLFFNKEILFCKVYNLESKAALEKIFLQNHISYFIEWGQQPLYRRILPNKNKEKNFFLFRINQSDVKKASLLVQQVAHIELIDDSYLS